MKPAKPASIYVNNGLFVWFLEFWRFLTFFDVFWRFFAFFAFFAFLTFFAFFNTKRKSCKKNIDQRTLFHCKLCFMSNPNPNPYHLPIYHPWVYGYLCLTSIRHTSFDFGLATLILLYQTKFELLAFNWRPL